MEATQSFEASRTAPDPTRTEPSARISNNREDLKWGNSKIINKIMLYNYSVWHNYIICTVIFLLAAILTPVPCIFIIYNSTSECTILNTLITYNYIWFAPTCFDVNTSYSGSPLCLVKLHRYNLEYTENPHNQTLPYTSRPTIHYNKNLQCVSST